MSKLLKEAIVDAEALREAALMHAEREVVNKYSNEVRESLETMLEQDDLSLPLDDITDLSEETIDEEVAEIPLAATDNFSEMDGQNLSNFPSDGDTTEITLDLGSLRESVEALTSEMAEVAEEIEISEDDIVEAMSTEEELEENEETNESIDETIEIEEDVNEELVDSIAERLSVEMGADLSGWVGRREEEIRYEMEKEMAHRRDSEVEKEMKDLKKAQEELVFENKQLNDANQKYKTALSEAQETLQTVNISNARLLYTNRILRNSSLNERQKNRIVETISKADSVAEAKTIYETLKNAVPDTQIRKPKSLSEAISRPTSVIRATRHESARPTDTFSDRMRMLAGIK